MGLKANQVFVPGAYPEHTYVERGGEGLETALRDALDTPGQIVSLSGPSKSGKTVLVERVVGQDHLIAISGARIESPDDIWDRALDWMKAPNSTTTSWSGSVAASGEVSASGKLGIPVIATGELAGKVGTEGTVSREQASTRDRGGLLQVVKEIAESDYVVLIDDFHYMHRKVQVEVAKALKEAVRQKVKIVTAAVRHRGDDVVRANPELRGRVRAVDLSYWNATELLDIANRGFKLLDAVLPAEVVKIFALESAGSPQLMQSLCLQACFVLGLREATLFTKEPKVDGTEVRRILEQTSSSTDFRSLVDVLDAGAKIRGTERKTYEFSDGTNGDVYRAVLKAIAADPPALSFPYDVLIERVQRICKGEAPVGSSVAGTCVQMAKLADKFPNERAIDWDDQKQILDIPDPYLLFYLRWSGRLAEAD